MELLRDPFWQSVAALITLAAIFVSVALWYLTSRRTRKALSFEIVTSTPLLVVGSEIEQRTQILFDGAPVRNLSLLIIRISNSGMVPILSSDFESPLSIAFKPDTKIFDVQIIETTPAALSPQTDITDTTITIAPLLLNPGDLFTVKLLVDTTRPVDFSGRIVGIRELDKHPPVQVTRAIVPVESIYVGGMLLASTIMVTLLLGITFDTLDYHIPLIEITVLNFILFIMSVVMTLYTCGLLIVGFLDWRKSKNRNSRY